MSISRTRRERSLDHPSRFAQKFSTLILGANRRGGLLAGRAVKELLALMGKSSGSSARPAGSFLTWSDRRRRQEVFAVAAKKQGIQRSL